MATASAKSKAAARSRSQSGSARWFFQSLRIALFVAALAGLIVYLVFSLYYTTHFFPHTTVNGIDAGGQEVAKVQELLREGIEDYELTIWEGDGESETIPGSAFRLQAVFGDEVLVLLATQNGFAWPTHWSRPEEKEVATLVEYDREALISALRGLSCMQPENQVAPVNAYLSDYQSGVGYTVVPEQEGTTIDFDRLVEAVERTVPVMGTSLNLSSAGVYVKPAVTQADEGLNAQAELLNQYATQTITYQFGEETEVLDGDTIHQWIALDGDSVTVDEEAAAAWVADLAERTDTYGKAHAFDTSYGQTVTITASYFGWQIDQEAEVSRLLSELGSGQNINREPEYSRQGLARGERDYGDTYAEVNLSAQHVFMYQDGELVLDSPCVTGSIAKGTTTPEGLYTVYSMEKDRYLVGENYRSWVNFWMPFNGGVGFHDATWRSDFSGGQYVSNGSHGCVNLPLSVAEKLYSYLSVGTPVFVYRLDSTASVSEAQVASMCVNKIASVGTVTTGSESAIKSARNMYNWLSSGNKGLVTNYDLLCQEEAELSRVKSSAAAAAAAAAAAQAQTDAAAAAEPQAEMDAAAQAAAEAALRAELGIG